LVVTQYPEEEPKERTIMEISKARRQGNSVIITIPAGLGVAEGEEFYLQRSDNGTILLIPKIRDYFIDAKEGEFTQPLEWENIFTAQGREEIE
jgi:antitoxin component of MazEF toxin-antitoxin module